MLKAPKVMAAKQRLKGEKAVLWGCVGRYSLLMSQMGKDGVVMNNFKSLILGITNCIPGDRLDSWLPTRGSESPGVRGDISQNPEHRVGVGMLSRGK